MLKNNVSFNAEKTKFNYISTINKDHIEVSGKNMLSFYIYDNNLATSWSCFLFRLQ